MSNTRNTPIEALERAYPIVIDRYAIRRGSGGAGMHRGGDGVVRAYRVLAPCTVTVLTERRARAPRGAAGGGAGAAVSGSLPPQPASGTSAASVSSHAFRRAILCAGNPP